MGCTNSADRATTSCDRTRVQALSPRHCTRPSDVAVSVSCQPPTASANSHTLPPFRGVSSVSFAQASTPLPLVRQQRSTSAEPATSRPVLMPAVSLDSALSCCGDESLCGESVAGLPTASRADHDDDIEPETGNPKPYMRFLTGESVSPPTIPDACFTQPTFTSLPSAVEDDIHLASAGFDVCDAKVEGEPSAAPGVSATSCQRVLNFAADMSPGLSPVCSSPA